MRYPGGKNGAGVYQTIINLMPPHTVYIEPFLGGGAIMRHKRKAWRNIGIDRDEKPLRDFAGDPRIELINGCGIAYLEKTAADVPKGGELIYCDPPYVHSTRKKLNLYRYEMSDDDHARLLAAIKALPCKVIISGYLNPLYTRQLDGWNYISYEAMTRGGLRTESLWFNFEEPTELHDYRFLGDNFRQRERIKRKKQRFIEKLGCMDKLERQALLAALDEAGIGHRQY